MVSQSTGIVDTDKITSIEEVLAELRILDAVLKDQQLEQFRLFNSSYGIVTDQIVRASEDNYFNNPKFVNEFIIAFSGYYFRAINDVYANKGNVALPWAKLMQLGSSTRTPTFIFLMLGANAHINHDLPQALVLLLKQQKPEDLLADILKIDKLLMKSGKIIIGTFTEPNKILNFLKVHFRFLYFRPAMYTILYWRIMAWRNYEKLQDDTSAMNGIVKRSLKIANRLVFIARILT